MNRRQRIVLGVLLPLLAVIATGCGDAINCALYGDNLVGRVNFTEAAPAQSDRDIIVELSNTGAFGAVTDRKTVRNLQGVLSVPFSHCASTGSSYALRAYQDSNGNGSFDAGEVNGRDDGTANGHGTTSSHALPTVPEEDAEDDWVRVAGIDIALDDTVSQ